MTAVKKTNYEFKPTGKPTGKKVHTGLSISSTNRINVKEQDHNKRQNVPSAKKADISQTNISKEKTEIKIKKEPMAKKDTKEKKEVNSIQVKKVVMTDTATNQSKLLNQKSTPALRNYNSNTNINPSKTTSKLAIKEIGSGGLIISHIFKAFCSNGKTVISKYISAGKWFISWLTFNK